MPPSKMNLFYAVLELIERKDWIAFQGLALSSPSAFQILSSQISQCEEFNGMTLLHAIVRHDPPSPLLKEMIRLRPEDVVAVDCLGRTPLHVAAGSGAGANVIRCLVATAPQACLTVDEDRRTPLHLACDSSCSLFEDEEMNARGPPDLNVVRFLLAGSQEAVLMEDIDDMTALEYAILSDDTPVKVVQLLQKVTQKQHQKRTSNAKESSPRRGSPTTVVPATAGSRRPGVAARA
ncbi:hypothetical protein ACHAXT_000846 [Thalassiosira profunda]